MDKCIKGQTKHSSRSFQAKTPCDQDPKTERNSRRIIRTPKAGKQRFPVVDNCIVRYVARNLKHAHADGTANETEKHITQHISDGDFIMKTDLKPLLPP